jgi:hypothetical protein
MDRDGLVTSVEEGGYRMSEYELPNVCGTAVIDIQCVINRSGGDDRNTESDLPPTPDPPHSL